MIKRSFITILMVVFFFAIMAGCVLVPEPPAVPTFPGVGTILIAEDDSGLIDLWFWSRNQDNFLNTIWFSSQSSTYGFFDSYDTIAAGNVFGEGNESIIIAEDNGGGIDIWGWNPNTGGITDSNRSFSTAGGYGEFDKGDTLVVGNVWGDAKDEIIISEDQDGRVDIWTWNGTKFELTGNSFLTQSGLYGPFDSGDILVVGDVLGDYLDEIIIADRDSGGVDIWGWENNKFSHTGISIDTRGGEYGGFDKGDAFAVSDVYDSPGISSDNGKEEIIVAGDNVDGVDVWVCDEATSSFKVSGLSFSSKDEDFGWFDKNDVLTVGNVLGDDLEEILIAEDDSGRIAVWNYDANQDQFVLNDASFDSHGHHPFDIHDWMIVAKLEPVVCVTGEVTDGNNHPLIDVNIEYTDVTNNHTIQNYSDEDGRYGICTFAGIQATLSTFLRNYGLETPTIQVVSPGTNVVRVDSNTFPINGDMTLDIDFGSLPAGWTSSVNIQDTPDYATMYFHTYQAMIYAEEALGVDLDSHLPENIHGFIPELITYHCSGMCVNAPAGATSDYIVIGRRIVNNLVVPNIIDSDFASCNRPDNREWHEFGHHIMFDSNIAGNNHQPDVPLGDVNHGGFYQNQSTADSLIEGWAEFTSLVIADVIEADPRPQLYRFCGGDPIPGGNYGGPNVDLELDWRFRLRESEEFAVAGILWDLYDGGVGDDDNVDLNLSQINEIVFKNNTVNLHELYMNCETYFRNNDLNLRDLRDIFINHGASGEPYTDATNDAQFTAGEPYDDQNNNGQWDEDVNWGYSPDLGDQFNDLNGNGTRDFGEPITVNEDGAGYNPPRPQRENKPPFTGSNLCLNFVDENGSSIGDVQLDVTRSDGNSYRLFVPEDVNLVYFYTPPIPTTIAVVASKEGWMESLPFVFNSTHYWRNPKDTNMYSEEETCFLEHTFILNDPTAEYFDEVSLRDFRRVEFSRDAIESEQLESYIPIAVSIRGDYWVKLLAKTYQNIAGELELIIASWVTYNPDGSVLYSGGPVNIPNLYTLDFFNGVIREDDGHIRWEIDMDGYGYIVPLRGTTLGLLSP